MNSKLGLTLANRALSGEGLVNPSAIRYFPKKCRCLWKKKREKREGGLESQKYDLIYSVHKPPKSGVFFALAVKTGVFALLLFTAKHLDQRGWA